MALKIELFNSPAHRRDGFDCGEESLNNYLHKQASQDLKKKVSTTFVLIDTPQPHILGYYTLSAFTVSVSEIEESLAKKLPRYPQLPATLLGRLAVDIAQQGQKLGELLLIDALARSLRTTTQVASVAVVVDALNEEALNFYIKYGFKAYKHAPMKLYLPMKSIASLLSI